MASELPVVASRTDPLPEILGDTGIIADHKPEALQAALADLLRDPGRSRALGSAARARAIELDGSLQEAREASLYRSLVDPD